GTLMQLLNLRFNFILLGGLAGPAALGIYADAAKYAEFLRLLPIAANWVLYPQFARSDAAHAMKTSRSLILRRGAITAAPSMPLAAHPRRRRFAGRAGRLLAGPARPACRGTDQHECFGDLPAGARRPGRRALHDVQDPQHAPGAGRSRDHGARRSPRDKARRL